MSSDIQPEIRSIDDALESQRRQLAKAKPVHKPKTKPPNRKKNRELRRKRPAKLVERARFIVRRSTEKTTKPRNTEI